MNVTAWKACAACPEGKLMRDSSTERSPSNSSKFPLELEVP